MSLFRVIFIFIIIIFFFSFTFIAIVLNNPLDTGTTYVYFTIGYLDGDTQVISAWSNPLTTQPSMGVGMCFIYFLFFIILFV